MSHRGFLGVRAVQVKGTDALEASMEALRVVVYADCDDKFWRDTCKGGSFKELVVFAEQFIRTMKLSSIGPKIRLVEFDIQNARKCIDTFDEGLKSMVQKGTTNLGQRQYYIQRSVVLTGFPEGGRPVDDVEEDDQKTTSIVG